jgi:hypothetical protein
MHLESSFTSSQKPGPIRTLCKGGLTSSSIANCDGNRKILFLDNLKAQTLGEFRDRLNGGNVKVWLLPPNCTDLIQPVDRHLAQQLKMRIRSLLEDRLVDDPAFQERWLSKGDADLRAKDVRILLTHIVTEAWKQICRERNFLELGLSTGCVMVRPTVDREQEKLGGIRITGLTEAYTFSPAVAQEAPADDFSPVEVDSPDDEPEAPMTLLAAGETDKASKRSGKGKNKKGNKPRSKKARVEALPSRSRSESSDASDSDEGNNLSEDSLEDDDGDREMGEEETFSPMEEGVNVVLNVVQDLGLLQDHLTDSTKPLDGIPPPLSAPPGYAFSTRPEGAVRVSAISGRKILWRIPLGLSGDPDWIIAEIIGGSPDPVALANGITMQLRCTAWLDRKPRHSCVTSTPTSLWP